MGRIFMFIVTDAQKLEQYGFEKVKDTLIEYGVNPDSQINGNRLVLYALDDVGVELLGKMLKDGVIKYVEA